MSTTRIKLGDGLEADLVGPEDADVPVAEEDITVIVIAGQHVGVLKRPGDKLPLAISVVECRRQGDPPESIRAAVARPRIEQAVGRAVVGVPAESDRLPVALRRDPGDRCRRHSVGHTAD